MLNLHPTDPLWLVPDDQIGVEISRAASAVWKVYCSVYNIKVRHTSAGRLKNRIADMGYAFYCSWDKQRSNLMVQACFKQASVRLSDVDHAFLLLDDRERSAFINYFKLVILQLWVNRVFLAPLNLTATAHSDVATDEICRNSGVAALSLIRSVNPNSFLSYKGKIDFEARNLRSTFWLRLLMSTTFYSVADVNFEDCLAILRATYGVGELPLRRYYVQDFLITMADGDLDALGKIERAVANIQTAKELEAHSRRERGKKEKKQNPTVSVASDQAVKSNPVLAHVLAYISFGGEACSLHEWVASISNGNIKKLFNIEPEKYPEGLYKEVPAKVRDFCYLINGLFISYLSSKRLQQDNNSVYVLNLLLSYISVYLCRFFSERDGSLDQYPSCINDFQCSLFITRNHIFAPGVMKYDKRPPDLTFLDYLQLVADIRSWTGDTLYARVLVLEGFFDYLVQNKDFLQDADKVINSFSPACYPRIRKKVGTVKKTVPRAYFSTFIQMLYSMEYLIDHLIMMGLGEMPGVVNDRLYQPSLLELQEHYLWRGLWEKERDNDSCLDLSRLNYCPIFYHDGTICKFDYLPRFFRFSEYEVEGRAVLLPNPNDIRVTILMCETGIRQQHLIWLNKERYGQFLDRKSRSQLAPLFVSSDKSHSEWVAIVARRVFDVLDRQSAWYDRSGGEEFEQDLWYGLKSGSKFGRYKPLFRLPKGGGTGYSHWFNYRLYPVLLFVLQYFIRNQIDDEDCDDFVFMQSKAGDKAPIPDYSLEVLSKLQRSGLRSPLTPHGLRAGFVTEAIRFLPPSIIGKYMTGQTEELVWYYSIFDSKELPSHQQLLANFLNNNAERLSSGEAPELAEAVLKLNARLMNDIELDPVAAIRSHGLVSLSGLREDQSGVALLRARRYSRLAYNLTHICPFDNNCPKEILAQFGVGKFCSLCPFAIRGVDHLRAISAEKDKNKEIMVGLLKKIDAYRRRSPHARNKQELEDLEVEYDKFAREAFALEAIEQQLYMMSISGQDSRLFAVESGELVEHLRRVNLTDSEFLIKRLIDVQNFPDLTSPLLDNKFAYMRAALLMKEGGSFEELLQLSQDAPADALGAQIKSMISAGALEVAELFRIGQEAGGQKLISKPVPVITQHIE